nr:hypothetical protein [Streptomyces goshikiensis]
MDLFLYLPVEERCRYEYAEVAVAQPGDQARDFADTDGVGLGVALGLKCEVDGDGVRRRPEYICVDSVTPSVAARPGDVDCACAWSHQPPNGNGAGLEVMRSVVEVVPDGSENGLAFSVLGKLVCFGSDHCGGRRKQRSVAASPDPAAPGFGAVAAERVFAGQNALDPGSGNLCLVEDGEPRPVVLEAVPLGRTPDRCQLII